MTEKLNRRTSSQAEVELLARWSAWAASRLGKAWNGKAFYFGNGHDHWGVQTNQKALAGFATAGSLEGREEWLHIALKMLRFSLETHLSGTRRLLDGGRWGHTWFSVLGVERMMHAIPLIEELAAESDLVGLRTMLLSEADWLLDHHPVEAGKTERNVPESNLWNGCLLYRVAMMYPEASRSSLYLEKSYEFIINSISVDGDATNEERIAGQTIKDWHVGSQFFDSMALYHHNYLNVGYMYICLSHVAIMHFSCKQMGWEVPEPLYRHAERLWDASALMTFPDGRLARIGGDTRVRYCYCQDYAPVVWHLMRDLRQDAYCCQLDRRWLDLVGKEAEYSSDGSFFGRRLAELSDVSWLYHSRLESDRAVSLSMALTWSRLIEEEEAKQETLSSPLELSGSWSDAFHGAFLVRGTRRLASWCWRAALPNQGLCVPVEGSDLAEWKQNLTGEIVGRGARNYQKPIEFDGVTFPGGFVTWGTSRHCSEFFCNEGDTSPLEMAEQFTVAAALPDDRTMLVAQRCVSLVTEKVQSVKGLFCQIQNDLYNESVRRYSDREGSFVSRGGDEAEELRRPISGDWVNVDDRLGLASAWSSDPWTLYRPASRQVGLKPYPHIDSRPAKGNLRADEICAPCLPDGVDLEQDELLYDLGFAVLAGSDVVETEAFSSESVEYSKVTDTMRVVACIGADSRRYALVANSGAEPCSWESPDRIAQAWGGTVAEGGLALNLDSKTAALCLLA